jgi:hypothetical protein
MKIKNKSAKSEITAAKDDFFLPLVSPVVFIKQKNIL